MPAGRAARSRRDWRSGPCRTAGLRLGWARDFATSADQHERLSELDGLTVLDQDLLDDARLVGLDLVHELHGFDDAKRVADRHGIADFDERLRARRGGPVE